MKRKWNSIKNSAGFFGVFFAVWSVFSQPVDSVRISPWRYGKPGAVSVSFDDGDELQYSLAAPLMEKYGIRGTFGIVGEWTFDRPEYTAEEGMFAIRRMSREQIKNLSARNHEIAAHGYRHRPYPRHAPSEKIAGEMHRIKNFLKQITGKPVFTLHYPYSLATDSIRKAASLAGFLFARTANSEKNFNTYENFDPYRLASIPILNDTVPSLREFESTLRSARGKWLIWMYHHIFPPGSKEMKIMQYHRVRHTYSLFPQTFERHMQRIARSGYWTAPEAEVGKYMTERMNTRIEISKGFCRQKIKLLTGLDPRTYDMPLTLEIFSKRKKLKIKQNGKTKIISNPEGKIMLEMMPGEEIIIKKRRFPCGCLP